MCIISPPLCSSQLPRSHRTILLRLMEKISKEHIHDISEELAKDLITLGSAELTLTEVSLLVTFVCLSDEKGWGREGRGGP